MIEVEVRGKIEDFDKLLNKFREKAEFIKEKDRFSLIYFTHGVVADVREIADEKIDLKLRVTDKKAEIIFKYGEWGVMESRKEISVPISLDKFDDAVELLNHLGWSTGVVMPTKTFAFDYKGIEFALVKIFDKSYFEAEILVDKENEVEKARNKIISVCKEFNVEIFKDEEFINMINSFNHFPGAQFDFSKDDFKDIKKKYKEFF